MRLFRNKAGVGDEASFLRPEVPVCCTHPRESPDRMRRIAALIAIGLLLGLATPADAGEAAPVAEAANLAATPLGDRLRGFAGIAAILGVCYALSENRRAVSRRA